MLTSRRDSLDRRRASALIVATWFSILSPLSWFIIFKAHSYVHPFLDPIVWQMPFVFYGFAVCGAVVDKIETFLGRQRKRLPAAACTERDKERRRSSNP
jgi:hypothetical protein